MSLPRKFTFTTKYEDTVYTATAHPDPETYSVSWEYADGTPASIDYESFELEKYLAGENWFIKDVLIAAPKYKIGDIVEIDQQGFGFSREELGMNVTITEVGYSKYIADSWCYRVKENLGNNKHGYWDRWVGEVSFGDVKDPAPFELKNGMRVKLTNVDNNMFIYFEDSHQLVNRDVAINMELVSFIKHENMMVIESVFASPESGCSLLDPFTHGLKLWPARTDAEIRIDVIKDEIKVLREQFDKLAAELVELGCTTRYRF